MRDFLDGVLISFVLLMCWQIIEVGRLNDRALHSTAPCSQPVFNPQKEPR